MPKSDGKIEVTVERLTVFKSTSSLNVIRGLKTIFAGHGSADEVRSDNGPQFHSKEFAQFANDWSFKHSTSTPRYPQANGEVNEQSKPSEKGRRSYKSIVGM